MIRRARHLGETEFCIELFESIAEFSWRLHFEEYESWHDCPVLIYGLPQEHPSSTKKELPECNYYYKRGV